MFNLADFNYVRVATAVPDVEVANTVANGEAIISMIFKAYREGVRVLVFPELCITGYTCGDLFQQDALIDDALKQVDRIAKNIPDGILVFVGAPLRLNSSALYNCAIAIADKKVVGIVPKTFVPNYSEFYEKRWFTPWDPNRKATIKYNSFNDTEVASKLIFDIGDAKIGCEICEDVWVPNSPSTGLALAGANIIVNLSAGNEVIGKAAYREQLISMNSAKNVCAYVYANAGEGESTQDVVFSGHSIIAEYGTILNRLKPFERNNMAIADIDVGRLNHERNHCETFNQYSGNPFGDYTVLPLAIANGKIMVSELKRFVNGAPFVPHDENERIQRGNDIANMQAYGLAKRINHVGCDGVVIGMSGGLDSTLAFMVACEAFDILGRDHSKIYGITMPGFGTTGRTKGNAVKLVEEMGATLVTIPIGDAAANHLTALEHPLDLYDITYENAQARERTQVLFDYANMHNLIVIGTGDLSELALGWCTYNGDQMSNYGVNASIPKTLVKWLVNYYACTDKCTQQVADILRDIIDTPVSPELLPPDENGNIAQKTENSIGSYELHDFFLYNVIRNGYSPSKIFLLAHEAIVNGSMGKFNAKTVLDTMETFYKRFFTQQFKRSCMPDGVKVGTIALSPRGDWRMPSDASYKIWLDEINDLRADYSSIWPDETTVQKSEPRGTW